MGVLERNNSVGGRVSEGGEGPNDSEIVVRTVLGTNKRIGTTTMGLVRRRKNSARE